MIEVPALLLPALIAVGFFLGIAGFADARRAAFRHYVEARRRQRQNLHFARELAQLDAMGDAFLAERRS